MKRKPLSQLTLLNRFLFARTMENREAVELVLGILFQRDVKLFEQVQTEKEVLTVPWLRSIRLDVFSMDEEGIYNAEVQGANTGNLIKRSRFYQALIDSSLLPPGEIDFNRMPNTFLIEIAPFDLFGENRYRYTFQMKCRESDSLWLEDGVTRIFFNTHGQNPEAESPEVVELLKYFEFTDEKTAAQCKSSRIHKLHNQVSRIKTSEEIGVKYMQEWEEKAYERLEGREEGMELGQIKAKRKTAANLFSRSLPLEEISDIVEEPLESITVWYQEWSQNQS